VILTVGNILSRTVYAPSGTTPVFGAWVSFYNPDTHQLRWTRAATTPLWLSLKNYVFDVKPPSPYNAYHESAFALTGDAARSQGRNITVTLASGTQILFSSVLREGLRHVTQDFAKKHRNKQGLGPSVLN
jgi:hypothetical protein